jgi:hypothetical protein
MIEMEVPQEYICKHCKFPLDSPNHVIGCQIQPVAPNVPLDEHHHEPGQYCRGCHELMGTWNPHEDPNFETQVTLTLYEAAEEALWDLQQWVKDHPANCDCFTCGETIPDLRTAIKNQP